MDKKVSWERWIRTAKGLVVCGATLVLLAGCAAPPAVPAAAPAEGAAAPAAAPGEPQKGGVLTVARQADANLWDPKFTNDNDSLWAQNQIYATLMQNSPDGKELLPWLAESFEFNDDATEVTFKLHDNAKFCDDTPITAEDVKWSLDRGMEEDSAVSWQFFSSPTIEVIDDLTVKFTLDRPNVAFPNYHTLWGMSILSKKYAEANGVEALSDKPLGSGPFCLDSWSKGQEIVLKPNPGYWGDDGPYVDEVQLKVVQDDNARVLQVQTGEADIALNVPYAQVEALKSVPGVKVAVDTLYGTAAIPLNQRTVPQFADKKVRQAMAYAIDRQALVDAVLLGQGEVAKSPFYGPSILYWTGDYEIPFDLEKAKQLMAESSAPDGFAAELTIPSGDTLAQQTAVILKDQLAQLNIDITITPVEAGTWWEMWSGGTYQMLYKLGTNDVIDPAENMPFDFWSKEEGGSDAAFTGFYNARIVELSKQAEGEFDPAKRAELYRELQQIAMDEVPQLWLFHPSNRWATRDNIEGFSVFPTGLHRFWQVSKTTE
jgi:peptide/nickel transport system substrate-binding protein